MNCGKGSCKAASNATFGFVCECDSGWKQTSSETDNFFKFLPCAVPNCKYCSYNDLELIYDNNSIRYISRYVVGFSLYVYMM